MLPLSRRKQGFAVSLYGVILRAALGDPSARPGSQPARLSFFEACDDRAGNGRRRNGRGIAPPVTPTTFSFRKVAPAPRSSRAGA